MAESPGLLRGQAGGLLGLPGHTRSGSGSESESEAELSLSLARTKTRSYGSTASVTAPAWAAERYTEHPVSAGDTLQGVALKYGVTMEQIKRANKLFTSDCIFLRKTLHIPVISEKKLLFNGLNSLESPDSETLDSSISQAEDTPMAFQESPSSPTPQEPDSQPAPPEELSAKDFLHRLDLQIKLSKQAAKKLEEEDIRSDDDKSYANSSYQQ